MYLGVCDIVLFNRTAHPKFAIRIRRRSVSTEDLETSDKSNLFWTSFAKGYCVFIHSLG